MGSIAGGLADYFMVCPLLKDGYFHVNYLGADPIEYTIETMTCDPILYRYVDGSSLRRYLFAFGSREYYSPDRLGNTDSIAFYEELSDWVEGQCMRGIFPVLPKGLQPEELKTISSGYLFDEAMESARYQIQMELIYYKEALHE